MNNMVIGLGNTGFRICEEIAKDNRINSTVDIYAIDSILNMTLDNINMMNYIPIVSDDKNGSGRDRTRGCAMYKYQEEQGVFDDMYDKAEESKTPVIVISSAAGGTGSGSIVPLCKELISRSVQIIPVIICPNESDPDAYHLNTSDLLIELEEIGIETYSIFVNAKGDANYAPINKEVVDLIAIVFGKLYPDTELDSIDDSDLDVILNTPGRFIAVTTRADSIQTLKKEITRKTFAGFQPNWEKDTDATFMTGFALTSIFASEDFGTVFSEINDRITNRFDEYRNIKNDNNLNEATVIIAGLPRPEIKEIDGEYNSVKSIGEGIKKSKRPSFASRKKAQVIDAKDGDAIKKFQWK